MTNLVRSNFQDHPFHLVSPSPWPLYTSICLLNLTTSAALSMHNFNNAYYLFYISLILVVSSMSFWFRDIISEGIQKTLYSLNISKAIPVEELNEALIDYKNKNNITVFTNKDNLGYYLAGLLEGDGHLSLPSLGNTTLNRVLNPRIVFTSHVGNLGITSSHSVLSVILLKLIRFHIIFRLFSQISKSNLVVSKALILALLPSKEINSENMLPLYQKSLFVGILLSDGWLVSPRLNNSLAKIKLRLPYFKQEYIYYLFKEISMYCDKGPYRYINDGKSKGKPADVILISTKWLHCLQSFYPVFYSNKGKVVPNNIFDLLTPLVLFHWIMGSGVKLKGRGLILYTDSFNIPDTVKLMNVLMIKYSLRCNLLIVNNKTRIYIYRSSLEYLIRIIKFVLNTSAGNVTKEMLSYLSNVLEGLKEVNSVKSYKFDTAKLRVNSFSSYNLNKVSTNNLNFPRVPQRRTISSLITEVKSKLNPWFITGFTDAEGCFGVYLANNEKYSTGWSVLVRFELHLHVRDRQLLEEIREFFKGVGSITNTNDRASYIVRSVSELEIIVKHFDNYPLLSKKYSDFVLFKSVVNIIKEGRITLAEISRIAAIKASMNKGLSDKLKNSFLDIIPAERPQANNALIPNPNWLVGFIEGEGCFFIDIAKSTGKLGERVQLTFQITQHIQDIILLQSIISFLGCGRIKEFSGKNFVNVIISKFSEIYEIIIPLLEEYPLRGHKLLNYKDFKKAAELMKSKAHLTKEGLLEIKKIKEGMNTLRK